ncbi:MAG: MDR family oxidoreductase [Chloroflexota bacterium]
MTDTFRALLLTQDDDRNTHADFADVTIDDLPEGEVLVKVAYSSLNYKDGLAVTGSSPVVRSFPMVPGIDFAGTVEAFTSDDFSVGDSVVLTGWGVGEKHWGGYAEYARVPAEYLVPLPDGLSAEDAMAVGTAGFTAMLAIMALEDAGVSPDAGEIVVTGAAGGTGSMAVAMLAAMGYKVVASTGRGDSLSDYLTSLGASEIIGRFDAPSRPLAKTRWAGAVDSVGGDTLAAILPEVNYGGSVACFGLAGGSDLQTTVFPFILRGVSLLGVDSVMCPTPRRIAAWERIRDVMTDELFSAIKQVEPLSNVTELAPAILKGDVRGRVVFDVSK